MIIKVTLDSWLNTCKKTVNDEITSVCCNVILLWQGILIWRYNTCSYITDPLLPVTSAGVALPQEEIQLESWPCLTRAKHHWFLLKHEPSILKLLLIHKASVCFPAEKHNLYLIGVRAICLSGFELHTDVWHIFIIIKNQKNCKWIFLKKKTVLLKIK